MGDKGALRIATATILPLDADGWVRMSEDRSENRGGGAHVQCASQCMWAPA